MHRIEFEFMVKEAGNPLSWATIEVVNAPYRPNVGDFVDVEGKRKVLSVRHFYGIPVANGREDTREILQGLGYKYATGEHMTLYVRLGPAIDERKG